MKNQHSLKIAVIVGKFPMVSETFIINQIGFLRQAGHQVDILCLGKKKRDFIHNEVISKYNLMEDVFVFKWRDIMPLNKLDRLLKATNILFRSIKTKTFFRLLASLNPVKYRADAINFNQFFRAYFKHFFAVNNYDVVHIHFADNAVQLIKQLHGFKKRVVVTFHGYDAHNYDASFYSELIKLDNIKYTVNTNFTMQKVIELGFPDNIITILPVGLDTSFFKPIKKEHKEFTVLFVGRLIEFKAPLLAIKIVERLNDKKQLKVHLDIIGTGDRFEECQQYIESNNLSDFITLLENKSQKEIKDYMNLSDVFLFPGIRDKKGRCENQGLVVQEAQSMKLPVIISDVGGIKEGIINNETGFVINANDKEGFVENLELLINDPIKLKVIGENGRNYVVKNYDNLVLGNKLLEIYKI
mgnify:CR=1 FL=1